MCSCTGSCGCGNSTVLPIGPTGTSGVDGIYGGFSGEWLYSSTTTVSPSTGQLRFNSNTSASVTNIYISNTGDNSIAYSLFLASLSNSGYYGWIRIFKEFDSTKFWLGKITNVVSVGTYYNLTVTYITASNASINTNIFTNGSRTIFSFVPKGETGAAGANGTNGTNGANGATGATGAQGPAGPSTLDYSWGTSDIFWLSRSAASYGDLAKIVFEGTTFHTQSPTKITVIARLESALGGNGDTGKIQIYDTTNSVVIGETAAINSNSWIIYDIPITGSFPLGQAIFSVQGKMSNTVDANKVYLSALSIRF